MFVQCSAFPPERLARTERLTGCPKLATQWRNGPIRASESHGIAH